MTEQEIKIQNEVIKLSKNKHVMIEFSSRGFNVIKESTCIRDQYRVMIYLLEPQVPADLDAWAEAIVKAEYHIDCIEKEIIHEHQNPNFYKSTMSKIYNPL